MSIRINASDSWSDDTGDAPDDIGNGFASVAILWDGTTRIIVREQNGTAIGVYFDHDATLRLARVLHESRLPGAATNPDFRS